MDSEIITYQHFRLAHQLKRRVRIISPVLKNDRERCYILEILLRKRPEIKKLRSVFTIGSIVIEFDPASLPKKNLLILLDTVLGNISQRKKVGKKQKKKEFSENIQEVDLAVQGMSCASCALLIEMVLNKDPEIKSASVNFATETVTVFGQLNKQQVSDKISTLGYSSMSMDTLSQRKSIILKEQGRINKAKRLFIG
jgi:Cu+-exporting ATPase